METTRESVPPRRTSLPLACLVLVLAVGVWFRLAHLGRADFGVDELYQVFAARSLATQGDLMLPSGNLYTRGSDVTRLVSLSHEILGVSEFSSRLPSAIFGIAGLLLFAAILWHLGGPWVAVAGSILLAMYPEAVSQSRELRFYTYQMLIGIGAFFTGWQALRPPAAGADDRRHLARGWAWAGLTVLLILAATRVQLVSLSVAAGWGACVLVMALAELRTRGRAALATSVPAQLAIAGGAVLLLILALAPDRLMRYWYIARSVPLWVLSSSEHAMSPLAYYYTLAATFPALLAVLPLLFLGAVLRSPRLAVYAALWYAVPVLLHSLVLVMKGERFILVPTVGLFVVAALGLVQGGDALRTLLQHRLHHRLSASIARRASLAAVAVVALFSIAATPAFHDARRLPGGDRGGAWSRAATVMAEHPQLAGLPLGSTRSLRTIYYMGRSDFGVDNPLRLDTSHRPAGVNVEEEEGFESRYTGAPLLMTPADIRRHFQGADGAIVIVETTTIQAGRVHEELVRTLRDEATDLCRNRCGALMLYHWPWDQRADYGEDPGNSGR
jgi:hypothetical protein